MHCQEKNEISRKIFAFRLAGAAPFLREEHIARLFAPAPAMLAVKNHVIGENVVLCFEAQSLRRLVDRARWPFQFQKNPEGGLVQFNHQAAQALGFETKDYILANYMVLYREHCRSRGEEPSNMLFAKKRRGTGQPESKNFS